MIFFVWPHLNIYLSSSITYLELVSFIRRTLVFNQRKKWLGLWVSLLVSPVLQAALPGAGQALRDVENTPLTLPPPVTLKTDAPIEETPAATPQDAPRLWVTGFRIEGNNEVAAAQLLPLLQDLAGKALNMAQLQLATQRIVTAYRQRGYVLAQAYLPRQEVTGGIIRIAVIEGRYGRVRLQNGSRVRDGVLLHPLSGLSRGTAVQGHDLERSLLLLSDIPGAEVKSTLQPGSTQGTTDLLVEATPGPWFSGGLEADNFGDVYTGKYRAGGNLSVNSPLRSGDRLDLRLLSSDRHQRYYRAAYQLPVGPTSARVGLAHSKMRYRLGKDFSELHAHGWAGVNSLYATQPLWRSRTLNVNAQLQFDDKRLQDDIDLFDSRSHKRVALWSAEIGANGQDRLFGGGQSALSLVYGIGRLHIDDPLMRQWDRDTADAAGTFSKLTLNALRLQNLSDRFQLYGQLNAQWAPGNLDASEKFSLGGPYGVRAFAPGSVNGDMGWQASITLRYALHPGWQLNTFMDQGQVWFNQRPWAAENNRAHLSAAGGGVVWGGKRHQVSLTAAWPLAHSGNAASTEQSPRIWIQAARYF